MIEEFIDSALIIDDKKEEVSGLKDLLLNNDILVNLFTPDEIKGKIIKPRKIVFLDLYISKTTTELRGNISEIRALFKKSIGKNFGAYGVVVWSAHVEQSGELREKMKEDENEYTLPLFIVGLDKNKYIKSGKFDEVFIDLNGEIKKNIPASFFIHWDTMVKKGKDSAITNIYSLVKDSDWRNENLKSMLFQLAKNYTGIPYEELTDYPLHIDAFKSFSDMLIYEINNQPLPENFFGNYDQLSFTNKIDGKVCCKKINYPDEYLVDEVVSKKVEPNINVLNKLDKELEGIYSNINAKLLIDQSNLSQTKILPGNVYQIISESPFKINSLPANAVPIVIEITPPCDFSQKNAINPRCIGGFLCDISKSVKDKYKKEYYYKEIWPIKFVGKENAQLIIFDFRYFSSLDKDELKNDTKYKLIFRAKDKLFADILQKLSAHIARLGLAIIH